MEAAVNFSMPVNEKYLAPFDFGNVYHIYNKTNNKELMFRSDANYLYFLQQFAKYISPVANTYAWNLLPNHFHLMIKVKLPEEISNYIIQLPIFKQTKSEKQFLIDNDINKLVEMEFKRFFTAYAMAYNSEFNRTGNLFYRTFKRVHINSDDQFTQALIYIHANAQRHKLVEQFECHKWTSYHTVTSDKPTNLLRAEIIEWFGCKEAFIKVQHELTEYYYTFLGSIEDDDELI